MKWTTLTAAALLTASTTAFSAAATAGQIDNTDVVGTIQPFGSSTEGESATATYGQTFTVGAENVLNGFSLFLTDNGAQTGTLNLRGYVAAWDGSKASDILYTSATRSISAGSGLSEFAFDTGALTLTAGAHYVLFLSVSELSPQSLLRFAMPHTADSYAGGNFVYFNNDTNFDQLTSTRWDGANSYATDAAFKARFADASAPADVPEPASLALLGLGLLGLSGWRRRR